MKLYGYWRSSASYRVRIALHHKGVQFEYVAVNLIENGGEQKKDDYRAKNPMEQVPIIELEEGGVVRRIGQSMAILEWLEESFPVAPLLPADPYWRARARQLAETINSGVQPFQNLTLRAIVKNELGGDDVALAKRYIEKGLESFQILATEVAGTFSVGDSPTFADCCLVPQLYSARSLGVDISAYPLLLRIEQHCNELHAFQAAHPDKQIDAPRTA